VRIPVVILAFLLVGCAHTSASSDSSTSQSASTETEIEATRVVRGSPTRPDGAVNPIDLVWVADVTAVENDTADPGMDPWCGDTDVDPPHLCPGTGTAPAPASPPESGSPPPPPD
jgi:hypothetical protein